MQITRYVRNIVWVYWQRLRVFTYVRDWYFIKEMALRKITTKLELTILIVARFNFINVQIDWYRLNNAIMCVIYLEMYLD